MTEDPAVLAARAERAQDPAEGLRAVAALRACIDELEARQVDRALERRWSWTRVGNALGISKQAAHRRHAHRTPTAPDPSPSPSPSQELSATDQRVVVTGTAQAVVAQARKEAAALGEAEVQPGHLLVALLEAPAGPAQDALLQLGIDIEGARQALASDTGRRRRRFTRKADISPSTRRVLEDSLAESQRLCHGHLGPEHLLLALLRDDQGPAVELLTTLGATPNDVESAVCDVLKHSDFARSL